MKFIFRLLGIIFFLIWIVIGAVLLVGGWAIVQAKPWQSFAPMMGALGAAEGLPAMMGGAAGARAGSAQEMMSKMAQFGTVKAFYESLSPSEQTCLKRELGGSTIADILANPQYKPSPDVFLKGVQCLNSK